MSDSKPNLSIRRPIKASRALFIIGLILLCSPIKAATGSWSAGGSNLIPAGPYSGVQSWADGQGSHVAPWLALVSNAGAVSVSPTPPTSASWTPYGTISLSGVTLEDIVCSISGKPVVYLVTNPSITHQVYYYDTSTSTYKLSFIPTPGNLGANLNNTQQGSYVGTMGNDIHGNITLAILSYFWRSTDDGKTFSYITDTANYIQPPLPNTFSYGNVVTTTPSYATNAPSIQPIAAAPYGGSTAPWGEMYVGKEFYSWRSYDDGQTWEIIDPLWYQPMRDTLSGLPIYQNLCLSFAMFGKGDGAGFTTDADVMINAFRCSSYINSGFPKFFRILPTGQIIHATNGDLDLTTSNYVANGYTLSQGAGVGMITTKSGDTFGSIVWNTLPAGNPLNRNHSEIVKWDCDTKLWTVITPQAGSQPAAIASYTFAKTAGDGDHFFAVSGPVYQWTPALGPNLRPDVTLNPVPGNFPLTVATDPVTHIASANPGNSFVVSDDHTAVGSLIYSWSCRGQGRVTFDNPAAFNTTAYFSNPGYYILTLTANDGSLSGAMSVTVKVLAPAGGGGTAPAIAVAGQPVNQILNVGQPISIPLTATGSNLSYQWKRNGMDIVDTAPGSISYALQGQTLDYAGTNTSQLTIVAGQAIDDGAIYYCEVSNEYGRIVSNSATIGNPPAIVQGPIDNSTTNGDLSVSASGTQPFQWQWYSGVPGSGTKIIGAQSSMYHTNTAGNYYVVITNIFGSATSASAQIGAFAGNSVTLNLGGVLSNGTVASSASFLVGALGTTIGIGTDSGLYANWLYFTKWNSGSAHVTIAPGFVNSPQAKFVIDSTASGTVSLNTSTAYFTNEYVLTVKNGFGTSSTHQYRFHAGDTVCVQAYVAPPGMIFNGWTVSKGGPLSGGFVANPGSGKSLTKFAFPSKDVELVATYVSGPGSTYTWNGGNGAWAVGTAGWDAGNWIDGVNAVIGKGTDTAGTITVAPAATINPLSVAFNAAQSGAYSLVVNGTVSAGATLALGSSATIRGMNGTINRTIQTGSTGIVWPGAAAVGSAVPPAGESLAVAGLDMSGGGTLKIALNTSSATSTQELVVTGAPCVLGGTLSLGVPAGAASGNAYTILTGSRTGTFATIKLNGTVITGTSPVNVQYTASSVTVTLTGSVTPVTVDAFTAKSQGAGTLLSWNCVSEYQNAGFNIYRSTVQSAEWVKVNPALIAGRITNADAKKYSFYDWAPVGMYVYKLESIDLTGARETYGKLSEVICVDLNSGLSSVADVSSDTIDAATIGINLSESVGMTQRVDAMFTALNIAGAEKTPSAAQSQKMNDRVSVREIAVRSNPAAAHNLKPEPQPAVAGSRWFSSSAIGGPPNYAAVKLTYKDAGVMVVPQSSMPGGYDLSHVSLQREGRSVNALAQMPGGLLVYAPGYKDDYTDKDAFFLRKTATATQAGRPTTSAGLFSSTMPVNVASPATVTHEYHDVYFDYNNGFRPFTFEPWFSSMYLTDGTTQDFTLNLPHATSGGGAMTVNVWSLTSNGTVNPDHGLQVLINGRIAGQVQWSGGGKMMQLTFNVPSDVLNSGDNTVSLTTPSIAGLDTQIAFLHSISVNYTRALDGSKPFEIANTGSVPQLYELYNIPAGGAWVVDTRFTGRAALVAAETLPQPDGTLRMRFIAGSGGTGKFSVTPMGQENQPLGISTRQVNALRLSGTYLATGPSQFAAGVQPLLAKRAKEGIRGAFVDQEQLFDYYNYGRYGPDGIRNAVRSVRPAYLLLVGRTTYDYLNYEGANVDPLCPAFLVATSFWAQTTSDSAFGDLGRGYPEVAVGRLPVNNTLELTGAVNHILNYKGIPASGIRLHAAADKPDAAVADFGTQLDTMLKANHPDLTWQENYLERTYQTSPEVTAAMKAAANGGADLIVYSGHGNAVRLGADSPRILDQTSVQDWTGNTVFLQATCTANWMAKNELDYKSIAIQALTQPQGGISASIGTSTYMNPDVATAFMNQLLKNANTSGTCWGAALLKTQQWAGSQTGSAFYVDMMKSEQLFGDPAMPIFIPQVRVNSRSSTPAGTY